MEAFQEASPLACSDIPALTEQAADAALFFDPLSSDDIARALLQLHRSPALRRLLTERGKLRADCYSWRRTADGRGRIYRPDSGFAGSIELMGWDELIKDARDRNQAFFDRAGISGRSYFSAD